MLFRSVPSLCLTIKIKIDDTSNIINDLENVSVSKSFVCSPELCHTYTPKGKSLTILHTNIRSLGNDTNFNNMILLIERISMTIDIIIVSECWLSKCGTILPISGYTSYRSEFTNQNEGVVAYVRSEINCTVEEPEISDANSLILKLADELAILALYRSPSHKNTENFIDSLSSTLDIIKSYKNIALIGDLNINIIPNNTDSNADAYLNMAAFHGLLSTHSFPTRGNNCLDHILLKTNKQAVSLIIDSLITDHNPILLSYEYQSIPQKTTHVYKRLDMLACVADIEGADFSLVIRFNNADNAMELLVNTTASIVASNTKIIVIPSRKRIKKPWITPGLLRCIRHRDKLCLNYKKNEYNATLKIIYTRYRNYCNNLLKKVKCEFERAQFQIHPNSPKATWNLIKEITYMNKKNTSSDDLLYIESDPSAPVDKVNNFFVNIGK